MKDNTQYTEPTKILTTKTHVTPEMPIYVGAYHETPLGEIVLTYGAGPDYVVYKNESGQVTKITPEEYHKNLKLRQDLKDYPNSKDPVLPYEFDLYYDIKRQSELRYLLKTAGPRKKLHLESMIKTYNIKL
jgi:hypothetical protein